MLVKVAKKLKDLEFAVPEPLVLIDALNGYYILRPFPRFVHHAKRAVGNDFSQFQRKRRTAFSGQLGLGSFWRVSGHFLRGPAVVDHLINSSFRKYFVIFSARVVYLKKLAHHTLSFKYGRKRSGKFLKDYSVKDLLFVPAEVFVDTA